MTQDDIIKMAIEAKLPHYWESGDEIVYIERVGHFAKLVAQHEREACAIVCDDINAKYKWPDDVAERVASQWCADSIRARGQA